jgi:hypothetical protein
MAQLPNFTGLTFTEYPVVTQSYNSTTGVTTFALNSTLVTDAAAGTSLVAQVSDVNTDRTFNPVAEGNPVASGDAAAKWLPSLAGFSAATVTDNLDGGNIDVGQVTIVLKPTAANTVEASSPMVFKVSQSATVTLATGTF